VEYRRLALPLVFAAALTIPLAAQQQTTVSQATTVDINGHVVSDGPAIIQTITPDGGGITETHQSINGQTVPLERVEEHVIKNDASGQVVERLIRAYDPQGNPMPPVKVLIEVQKHGDGSVTTQSTTSRGDINGSMQVIERTTTDTHPNSSGETSQTVVERETADGLRPVEKRDEVVVKQPAGSQSDTSIYRADGNGSFQLAVRETTEHKVQGSESSDSAAEYEIGPTGELQLHNQTVTKTVKRPDGGTDAVVNIYGRNAPGAAASPESSLQLIEQQSIDTAPGPNHTMVQTLNARRPTVSDPGTLGPPQKISQIVCSGDCKPPAAGN
jgi:hypothetical protein